MSRSADNDVIAEAKETDRQEKITQEAETRRVNLLAERARQGRIDAVLAKLTDPQIEKIREALAVEYDAIDPRLGDRLRKKDPRKSTIVRAKIHELFFAGTPVMVGEAHHA